MPGKLRTARRRFFHHVLRFPGPPAVREQLRRTNSEDHSGSDFDVLVEFTPGKKTFRNFAETVDLLERELEAPVELVTKEGLSPYIGPKILEEVEYVPIAS